MIAKPRARSAEWTTARLGDVAAIDRHLIQPTDIKGGAVYVGLEHIESGGKTITPKHVQHGDLASTKFAFTPDHVLYGKLRPYLAKIALPDFSGICSTDILPVLPGADLDRRYLCHYLRQPKVVEHANSLTAGANLPRLSPSALANFQIPLPPLPEQKRIASILDKADDIRRRRGEAIGLNEDFLRSLFLEMFGDPVTNPKGWPEDEFGNLVSSTKLGLVRSSKEFGWSFPTPYVRMDAISSNGRFLPEKVQGTHASAREIKEYGLTHGDFLFNTRNSKELVGKSAVYDGPESATFNNNLMRIRFRDGVDPYIVRFQFDFARAQIALEQRKQGTTSVFAIYWKNLATLPILVPPPKLQRTFRAVVDRAVGSGQRLKVGQQDAEALFRSLQHRAFRGEL